MFNHLKRADRDPENLQVQKNLTVGDTIKSLRLDTCTAVVRGQLLALDAVTADVDGECVNLVHDTVAIHGTITGDAESVPATRFASYGQGPTNVNTIHAVKLPYAATIVGFAVQYMHPATAFSAGEGDQLDFTIGAIPANSAHSAAVYAANILSADPLISFTEDDDSTHPSKSATGLSIAVPAGHQIAVRSVETGSVGAVDADYAVTIFVRGQFV